ncbi:hypothetical protein AEYBE204_18560 [Asticcacaulis sp. YBE204]|nr:hypothetical protein AEYBE204_18560 [Asticcacaulis sp. YBE204]
MSNTFSRDYLSYLGVGKSWLSDFGGHSERLTNCFEQAAFQACYIAFGVPTSADVDITNIMDLRFKALYRINGHVIDSCLNVIFMVLDRSATRSKS